MRWVALFLCLVAPAQADTQGTHRFGAEFPAITSARGCEAACRHNPICGMWTFIRAGYEGSAAKCISAIRMYIGGSGDDSHKGCCVSGMIRR
jgi:hypothetical protein